MRNLEVTEKSGGANPMKLCPLCQAETRRRFGLKHTGVWECVSRFCGLLFAYPQLDDKRLAEAYGLHYYPASGKGNIAVYENTPVGILRQTFDRVEAELGPLSEKKLLDFGCGVGRLCQVAGEHGISAVGIEFDAQARATASKAANLRVYATLDELRATEGDPQFDIVTMWDVIEHLREPWKELGLLSSLLQHNGWLLLSTPNAECLKALLQRKRWEDIVNPTH